MTLEQNTLLLYIIIALLLGIVYLLKKLIAHLMPVKKSRVRVKRVIKKRRKRKRRR